MKENGQHPAAVRGHVVEIPFRPTAGSPPVVEVIDFPRLLTRAQRHGVDLGRPLRLGFHEVIALRSGELTCSVDFVPGELRPGDWLWAWPGQVVRFHSDLGRCDGRLLVFPSGVPSPVTSSPIQEFGHRAHPVITSDAALTGLLTTLEDASASELPLDAHIETMRS